MDEKNGLLSTYQIFITGDGSPTLYFTRAEDAYIEKMHNSKGAYAESLYIYGEALDQVLQWPLWSEQPKTTLTIGSLGLGLAYNEIISIAKIIGKNLKLKMISFEKDRNLTKEFLNWLNDEASAIAEHYQWILEQTAKDHRLAPNLLKETLKKMIQQDQWQIREEFPQALSSKDQFHLFYYDAFSNKMSPELWIEDQLKYFVKNHTASSCMLSTYAATGAMKRALKENNFRLLERPGFGGKRESILGLR